MTDSRSKNQSEEWRDRELVQPHVDGKPFRCECGGNVFKRLEGPSYGSVHVFACNACGRMYEGTAASADKR